ncbi:MAG TPA: TetR family transcriptional regulator [Streptosporangiaceae bacterium]|nr:TetR family transcriptional regulator [Streptosporangiaceae bacterium]
MDCAPEGLRERKKAATRRALGLAAMRLAVLRGLENVLVEDIAAEAGVSARTFNNYFASKYEAICALAMERSQRMGAELRSRPAAEPLPEAIRNAVLEAYEGGMRTPDREWIDGVRLVIASPALQGEYLRTHYVAQRMLAEAIADRTGTDLHADMFPAVLAGAVTAAIQVAHERWLHADPPVALVPLITEALAALRFPSAPHAESELACHPRPREPILTVAAQTLPEPAPPRESPC